MEAHNTPLPQAVNMFETYGRNVRILLPQHVKLTNFGAVKRQNACFCIGVFNRINNLAFGHKVAVLQASPA